MNPSCDLKDVRSRSFQDGNETYNVAFVHLPSDLGAPSSEYDARGH